MEHMTETAAALPGQSGQARPASPPPAAPPPPAPPAQAASLRERKKQATRRSLRRIALQLISDRGFAAVTVEDIAAAADVSPRTFFNYFPSKEAAVFGADPERTAELLRRIVEEAPGETALEALRRIIVDEARHVSAEIADMQSEIADWKRQMRASQADPQLRAARAAHMAAVESDIATALAQRLGTDTETDPYPIVLASAGMAVMRSAFMFWPRLGGAVPLEQFADAAIGALARGLPEDGALRALVARPSEPGPAGPAGAAGPPAQPVPPPAAETTGPPGAPRAAPATSPPNAPAAPAAGSPERNTADVIA
jgi:AcrR family transcriptional regulator